MPAPRRAAIRGSRSREKVVEAAATAVAPISSARVATTLAQGAARYWARPGWSTTWMALAPYPASSPARPDTPDPTRAMAKSPPVFAASVRAKVMAFRLDLRSFPPKVSAITSVVPMRNLLAVPGGQIALASLTSLSISSSTVFTWMPPFRWGGAS